MYPDSRKTRLKQIGRVIDGKRLGEARQMLQTFLKQYPQDAEGWFLASTLMVDPQRQLDTLYKVLKFDPNHQQAVQKLKVLKVQQPELKFDESFQELIDRAQPILSKPVEQRANRPLLGFLVAVVGLVGIALLAGILTIGYLIAASRISLTALLATQTPTPTVLPTDTPTMEPSPTVTERATETEIETATAMVPPTDTVTPTDTQILATIPPPSPTLPSPTPPSPTSPSPTPPSPTVSPSPFGSIFVPFVKDNLTAVVPIAILRIAGKGALLKIAFGADDSHLAVANGGKMAADIWDFATNRESAVFGGSGTLDIAFDRSGRLIATASVNDNTARVWDAATGSALYSVSGHTGAVRAVAFSPDGNLLATGALDNTVRLWRADTGAPVATIAAGVIIDSLTFNASSSLLAAGGLDGSIQIWNVNSRQLLKTLHHSQVSSSLMYAKFFGNTLASTNGSSVILWDTSGAAVRTIATPEGSHSVALNPNLQLFALAGNDNMVRVGDIGSGKVLLTLKAADGQPVQSVTFSPDGKLLASGSLDGTIRLWAVNNANTTLAGHATAAKTP